MNYGRMIMKNMDELWKDDYEKLHNNIYKAKERLNKFRRKLF